MQLRRFLTGLTAAAVVGLVPVLSSATTMVSCGALDCTVVRSGEKSLIISGKVTDAKPVFVNFPNSDRRMAATEFTILGKVIKGNELYKASDDVQTAKVKVFGQVGGPIIKGMPRPQVGMEGMHIFYGNSVLGLTSYAFGYEGQIPYKDVGGGKMIAVSPYGKGLVFSNKALAAKFLKVSPASAKLLRTGPVPPVEPGEESAEGADVGEAELTPEVLESAVKTILQGDKE